MVLGHATCYISSLMRWCVAPLSTALIALTAIGRPSTAQLDWRPLLPRIGVPCLNVIGGRSGIFPVEGTAVVGQLIPHCHTVRLFAYMCKTSGTSSSQDARGSVRRW